MEASKSGENAVDLKRFAKSAGRLLAIDEVEVLNDGSRLLEEIDKKYVAELTDPNPMTMKLDGINLLKNTALNAVRNKPELSPQIMEIVLKETLHGYSIPEMLGKWSIGDEEAKMAQLLKILLVDSELAELIVGRNILGFHGTRSGALVGILQNGAILSAEEARSNRVGLVTGERLHSSAKGQPTISFSDWREPKSILQYSGSSAKNKTLGQLENELAELNNEMENAKKYLSGKYLANYINMRDDLANKIDYIKNNPNSVESELMLSDFPIAFAFSGDKNDTHYETIYEAKNTEGDCIIERVSSDIPGEFLIKAPRVPLERMPAIATTTEHIDQLRILLDKFGYENIKVVNLESINAK